MCHERINPINSIKIVQLRDYRSVNEEDRNICLCVYPLRWRVDNRLKNSGHELTQETVNGTQWHDEQAD